MLGRIETINYFCGMAEKRYILTPEEYKEYKSLKEENVRIKAEYHKQVEDERLKVSKAINDLKDSLIQVTGEHWYIDFHGVGSPGGVRFVKADEERDRLLRREEALYKELRFRTQQFPYFYHDKQKEIEFAMKHWNSSWWNRLRDKYFQK